MSALTSYVAPVREYRTAEEMRAEAARLRRMTFAGAPEPIEPKVNLVEFRAVRAFDPADLAWNSAPPPTVPMQQFPPIAMPSGPRARARAIIKDVAEQRGFTPGELRNNRRHIALVNARREAMARVYVECPELSLPQIGRLFDKDHTTVMSALRKAGVYGSKASEKAAPATDERVIEVYLETSSVHGAARRLEVSSYFVQSALDRAKEAGVFDRYAYQKKRKQDSARKRRRELRAIYDAYIEAGSRAAAVRETGATNWDLDRAVKMFGQRR